MRLLRLELTNWCSHESLAVDLSGGLQIEGRNGTGKSSILEAIRFAFRENARGYSQRIRNGSRSACVRLTFEDNCVKYSVERRLYVDKASSAIMEADGVLIADNPSSVHQRLKNMLPESSLDNLIYIPQGGLTRLLERLSGKDGKIELDRLFGLDRLERVWQMAAQDLQEEEIRLKLADDELKKYPENAQELLTKTILEKKATLEGIQKRVIDLDLELQKVKKDLVCANEKLTKIRETKKTIEGLALEKARLQIEQAHMSKELENCLGRITDLAKQEKELDERVKERHALIKYKQIRESLQRLKSLQERIGRLAGLGAKRDRLSQLNASFEAKAALETELSQIHKHELDSISKQAAASAELASQKLRLQELSTLDGKPKCPHCGQDINPSHLMAEVHDAKHKIEPLEAKIRQFTVQSEEIRMRQARMQQQLKALVGQAAEAKHLALEIAQTEAEAADLEKARQSEAEALTQIGYAGEDQTVVEAKYMELNRIEGIVQSMGKTVSELQRYKALLASAEEKSKANAMMLHDVSNKLSSASYDPEEEGSLSVERDRLSDRRFSLDSEISSKKVDAEHAKVEITSSQEKLSNLSSTKIRFDDISRRLNAIKSAREVFHRDKGIVRYLRERYLFGLNTLLSRHFKRFNENPHYLDVSFDRDYRIIIRTTNGDLDVSQLSGGELIQLALALRISLIDLMSSLRLLILDEPFGSLDAAHRELLGEALNLIAQDGQLILVTHVQVESLHLGNTLDLGGY